MIYLSERGLFKTCQEILNSDVKLVEIAKQTSSSNLLIIYGEITAVNQLTKDYPDKKKRLAQIAKLIKSKDSRFHTCRYDKQIRKLYIDDTIIDDVIVKQ